MLILYWGVIFLLTHLPAHDLPHVRMSDKLEHFLAYGMFGGLLFLAFWSLRARRAYATVAAWTVGLAYGAIDEWLQILVGRDCELKDWLADASGVTIAVLGLSLLIGLIQWIRMSKNRSAAPAVES